MRETFPTTPSSRLSTQNHEWAEAALDRSDALVDAADFNAGDAYRAVSPMLCGTPRESRSDFEIPSRNYDHPASRRTGRAWRRQARVALRSAAGAASPDRHQHFGRLAQLCLPQREANREAAAASDFAVDIDRATVLAHERIRDRQAKPGALSDRLGREERLEDPIEVRLRYAAAGVLDATPMRRRPWYRS